MSRILKTHDFQFNVTMTRAISARIIQQKVRLLGKAKIFGRPPWSIGLVVI